MMEGKFSIEKSYANGNIPLSVIYLENVVVFMRLSCISPQILNNIPKSCTLGFNDIVKCGVFNIFKGAP